MLGDRREAHLPMKWIGVVLARPDVDGGGMVSSVPTYLHPVAGRPLLWHTVSALADLPAAPEALFVVAPPELTASVFEGFDLPVQALPIESVLEDGSELFGDRSMRYLMADAGASLEPAGLRALLKAEVGAWVGQPGEAAATLLNPPQLHELLRHPTPFQVPNGTLSPLNRLPETPDTFVVRTRADLVRAHRRVRDQLVRNLMEGGVTFLLPESVIVDVDVSVGRDSVVYPGVVLEGETTVGEETVIGPGCRIIDSWIGRGVELKGWNYIAHTSVRNRAILEPYVRRGFD
jgi:hypothetical protein